MIIKRKIQAKIEAKLFRGKAIIIYGPRRSGKTTLIKNLAKKYPDAAWFNCDEFNIRNSLANKSLSELKITIGNRKLVFIDEAQRVKNIGLTIKLLVDNLPQIQVVATGSSSFELSNQVVEPLTGRKYEFYLYPFAFGELAAIYSPAKLDSWLERWLIYGSYPEVITSSDDKERHEVVAEIVRSYLYKDVLQYQQIKNPDVLEKLLQAVALQIGSGVSYNELAILTGVDKKTVERYLRILEQAFIIFRVKPYSRNQRKEIGKLKKIYFTDLGVRNALINNLNPLSLRQDTGRLWENFLISERLKNITNQGLSKNCYFWRTYRQEEIDWLEEEGGKISAYEFKWQAKRYKAPKAFSRLNPGVTVQLVNRENYPAFIAHA